MRRKGQRTLAHQRQRIGLALAETGGAGSGVVAEGAHDEVAGIGAGGGLAQGGIEGIEHFRETLADEGDGNGALGADAHRAVHGKAHLAVAAETDGGDVDRRHHGAPAAHRRAVLAHPGAAVDEDAEIGGGAAHVGHDEGFQARQAGGPDKAGGGPRQHRLDGPERHLIGERKRAVALHHHQRAVDAEARHGRPDRLDEIGDARDEAGVEHGGERPARGIEGRRQFARYGDWLARLFDDALASAALMGGIAHGEAGGDGEGLDLAPVPFQRRIEGGEIEGLAFIAVVVMAAGDADDGHRGKGGSKAGARQHGIVEAGKDGRDRTAMALHHGVGGERGGDRDEADAAGGLGRRQQLQHPGHRLAHADGEIAAGGERLGGGNDGMGGARDDDGIGIGAAGVDADQPGALGISHRRACHLARRAARRSRKVRQASISDISMNSSGLWA